MIKEPEPKSFSLTEKVIRAAEYYFTRSGRDPNVCFLHPSMLQDESLSRIGPVELRTNAGVAPNHLWLGWQDPL